MEKSFIYQTTEYEKNSQVTKFRQNEIFFHIQ